MSRLIDLYEPCLEALRERLALDGECTMTDATEAVFGSSGRGSRKAVLLIELMAKRGAVVIDARGRGRYVSLPASLPTA